MTESDAANIKKAIKAKEIEVRGFLSDEFQYYNAYEERALVIAEANTDVDEKMNFKATRV